MPLSIGVNLRVTGHCNQGGRKYMEDMFSVAYQQSSNDRELEYAFFGIFDGHGGGEAATFAKENLMDIIVKQKNFWSDNDEDVLKAIRDGYVNTHYAMWRELDKWPRTASGLPSTAGTTASIAFIRKGKIYIGHVGDSAIILGYQEKGDPLWKSKALTRDHKPECGTEMTRIQESGGKVISKSGVPRVVWNRPRLGHKGPVRRSTHIDEIPFLAVARSLGDLWSYNSELNTFVVSPEPDVKVIKIDVKSHRCLIFGTDGLWNMLTPQAAVAIVQAAEKHNEKHLIASQQTGSGQGEAHMWINPSKSLVDRALDRWLSTRLRADNTSVVTLMLDPPGPTHSEILLSQKREQMATNKLSAHPIPETPNINTMPCESLYHSCPSALNQISPNSPEPEDDPIPTTAIVPALPVYSDIQKYPDSSEFDTTVLQTEENASKHHLSSSSKKEIHSCINQSVAEEESIQVAEISSSNATDEPSTIREDTNNLFIEAESMVVESSLFEESTSQESDLTITETKFILEKKSWLQQVPAAEQYTNDEADLQSIRFSEPTGPRLRRGIHDNSDTPKRITGTVMRQTNGRRRHSTGAPQNSQRQQRQRRSLTPKSAVTASPFMAAGNKLKRRAKEMSNYEEAKVAVSTRHSAETESGESCLKRRTRSEDVRNMQDENDPSNQAVDNRLRWPITDTPISRTSAVLNSSTHGIQERRLSSPNSFKRRNLEKKVTPVKTIRRPSISRSATRIQMRENFWDQGRASRTGASCSSTRRQTVVGLISSLAETVSVSSPSLSAPKRWLRSDTIAATPIKTLRSRNVDIAGHTVTPQLWAKSNRLAARPHHRRRQHQIGQNRLVPSIP
ncbi:uncharacterized protein LOC131673081 isoform X2 [Phymastichus coffea]|uniref:uncharacterized protein LOC131673081 isoform X2 n=1 Tax=Phymastichus coffea TaxID=108790 RepID=UPI00273CB0FF|nr:uncharacterized protein LOC131673081 isoform X2 [Phymastichus coffea]